MSKLLKVSRNSIREALKTLETNNIIVIKHGSGVYVNSFGSLDFSLYESTNELKNSLIILKQLAQARQMIETFCSVEVSKIITDEQLQKLYDYEDYENSLIAGEKEGEASFVYPGLQLELMITDFYGNSFIKNNHEKVQELWKKHLGVINSVPFPLELRHGDHLDIINSIKSKSNTKIEKAMGRHIARTIEAIDKLLESQKKS